MSCRRNSPNLSEVQVPESIKKDALSSRQKKLYGLHLLQFNCSPAKKLSLLSHIFFAYKIKRQLKITSPLVWSSVDWGEEGELRVVLYGIQNVSGLMLKKKLLPLVTELVVILNHLGVIRLWRPQKIINIVWPPTPSICKNEQ